MIDLLKIFMITAVCINITLAAQRVVVCEESYGAG